MLVFPKALHEYYLGWGGVVAVILIRRFGRLPILFWSQVGLLSRIMSLFSHLFQLLALGFMVGCTFAPNLKTFTGENMQVQLLRSHF